MRAALAVAAKDLRAEVRAREIAPAMGAFALALVFLFSFVLPPGAGRAPPPLPQAGAVATREVVAAFLWISLLFAALVGFGRHGAMEKEDNRVEALALAPVDPGAVFLGKAAANFVFLTLVEVVVLPFFILLLDLPPSLLLPEMLAVMALANLGLAFVGVMFATATQYARARELVLPLLSFPVMLPLILAAVRLTASLISTGSYSGEVRWFILMGAFDLAFGAVGASTYTYVINE